MSEDKLGNWLNKEGLFGKKKTTAAPAAKPAEKNETTSTNTEKTTDTTPQNNNADRKPRPNNNRNQNGNGNKSGGGGGGFRRPNLSAKPTSNDPTFHRPTAEKRDKFHPTNFIKSAPSGEIRVVPIGGMEQVGMNMMFIEWDDTIIIIDTGLVFASPEHLGIDAVVPDLTYLVKNKHKIKGVFYTHGHLDHIGGAPYILPDLGYPPLFATRLTKELLVLTCDEHLDRNKLKITEITPKSKIKAGKFEVEFFHVNHSIPDGVGIVVNTPYGAIVDSSDFKFDHNPADDQPADLGRIAEIGRRGVVLGMIDSTNSLKSGHTISERVIAEDIAKIIKSSKGRILMATFASNIGRVAKAVEAAEADGRTVFLSGRSMERNIAVARKLNYLKCKEKTLQIMSPKADKMDPSKVMILSTGSQGETLAALTRMAAGTHPKVTLRKEDTVVFASSPIPGNDMAVVSVLNNLADIGCKVIDHKDMNTHVSGHGNAEECKLMCALLNPKYMAPIHGEVYMRKGHGEMVVRDLGYKPENVIVMKNGRGAVVTSKGVRLMTEKEAIPQKNVLIQNGEKVQESVLKDRQDISETGIIIVNVEHEKGKIKNMELRARGFQFTDPKNEIFQLLEKELRDVWTRQYDSARPEKGLESAMKVMAEKILYKRFRKDYVIEVMI
ncbi:ribonuclease J [bacterium]|nr:ribonuclease J [bacterium]NCQ54841.1 ribonuclease J [Candidatus Parcubacteria bacterium]NCS66885.1 ribonuclease J [Candidatus Peregrinibacteria bacterium]NCS95831.1 ribonuclease J [bacterium]